MKCTPIVTVIVAVIVIVIVIVAVAVIVLSQEVHSYWHCCGFVVFIKVLL